MTDRRRNLSVLLLVGALLLGSVVLMAVKSTKLGLDLKGGIELVYEGKPTKESKVTGDAINRSIDIMRKRVDALGVSEPEIQRNGGNQITVSLPDAKNADDAVRSVGKTAQLFFYDWEKNVLGKNDQPAPADASVTGGQSAGNAGCLPQYDAIARARRRPAQRNTNQSAGPKFYLVDDKLRKVLSGPQDTRADLLNSDQVKGIRPTASNPTNRRVVEVQPGTIVVQQEIPAKAKGAAKNPDCYYVLNDFYALKGTDIKNPEQNSDQTSGAPNVTFDFTSSGRSKWKTTTKEIAQRGQNSFVPGQSLDAAFQHFAIVLDNQLISVPYIDFKQNPNGIDGGSGSEISGGFTIDSAQDLANELKYGALPIKLQLVSQSQVSATLGKQALHQGLIAGLVGFAVVALFLLAFYRVLGVIAVGALVVYAVYFYALIKLIPITLTLPGIAGLILTIGVAADANIVIFERVKEEIRGGRSVAAGIAAGYKKGIAAIVDANVVTFMTAFVLFMIATAGVRGFAFTLGIGTLVSLFTAVLLTQAVLGSMGRSRMIGHPSALGAGKSRLRTRFDYTGAARYFFSLSGIILLVCALALGSKGINFGIDFESGTRITVGLQKATNEDGIRTVLNQQGIEKSAEVQRINDKKLGNNAFQISTSELQPDRANAVVNAIGARYQLRGPPDTQSIGPTFGNTVAKSAVIAIIASLLVISAYIALRFEWKYAVPVLIALMHDILITSGVYALTGREVTQSTVAALLTILGYSLYDTIIVFDRIRENVPRMPRAAFSQIVNRSMSEVVMRSLATSISTCFPILALLLFGGDTLKDFAFALLVGVISGAYSSVFIASPVLTHWKEREPLYVQRTARIRRSSGGVVPAFAVATSGAQVDVAPKESKRKAARGGIFSPDDPQQGVSQAEFNEMVRELDVDAPQERPKRRRTLDPEPEPEPERPRRSSRRTADEEQEEAQEPPASDDARDLRPDELVMKDDRRRPPKRRSSNKRHGRPR